MNIEYTTKYNLCTGCGICTGACPTGSISMCICGGEYRPLVSEITCLGNKCSKCTTICPGLGINLVEYANKLYKEDDIKNNIFIGNYIQCYTGYSNDEKLRFHSASGGLLSQFLIWLLKEGHIDGAVVSKFDNQSPLKVKTFIATTIDEVCSSKSSKYSPVSFNNVVKELREASGNKYIVVGLPCHIEGMRKLMKIDRMLREKIVGLFSIYCSGTRTFNFTEYLFKSRGINIDNVEYLAYRDNGCLGGMVVKGEGIDYYEDYQRYSHPLRTIFYPRRCLLCADHFGELADVCFGDVHIKPYSNDKVGVNSVVVRTNYWNQMLIQACEEGYITLNNLDESVLLSSQKMAKVKKSRNVAYGLLIKKFGGVAPDYGSKYDGNINIKVVINYLRMCFERFIGRHKSLWWIIPLIKSKIKIH